MRVVGWLVAAGAGAVVARIIRRRVAGVRRVNRSVIDYQAHWDTSVRELQDLTHPEEVLRYVALGDSAAQGVGASSPDAGYVPRIARELEEATGRTVVLYNLSVSGAKATDVVATQLPQLAGLGFTPDVLTLDIGGNDVMDRSVTPDAFVATMRDELLPALPPGSFVADVPWFTVPPFAQRAKAMADGVAPAIRDAGHHVVPLHRAMATGGWLAYVRGLAEDVFHPSDRGYAGWAATFLGTMDEAGVLR